jgi:ketosteroid isomerase-like protein
MTPGDVVAAYAAAWERGDHESAFAFYADDVTLCLPGRGPLAGASEGKQAVIAAIKALLERTSEHAAEVVVVDRLESSERIALVVNETVTRANERLDLRRVNLYRVVDEKIVEIDIFEADQYEVDEFFA